MPPRQVVPDPSLRLPPLIIPVHGPGVVAGVLLDFGERVLVELNHGGDGIEALTPDLRQFSFVERIHFRFWPDPAGLPGK